MRKVFLDDLPKKCQKISWANSVGKEVYFEFDDIKGKFEILDYRTNGLNPEVFIKYGEILDWVYTSRLVNCKIKRFINAKIEKGKKGKNLIGKKFGKLIVIEDDGTRSDEGQIKWKCKCDCGKYAHVVGYKLEHGYTKSCGCIARNYFRPATKTADGYKNTAVSRIIGRYKSKAKERNIDWELSRNDFISLIQQPCHYCGIEHSLSLSINENFTYLYNGIDRIDSNLGYFSNNVVPCCKICNMAKSDLSQYEFFIWINRACNHINDFLYQ